MGVTPEHFLSVHQIHSPDAVDRETARGRAPEAGHKGPDPS